MTGNKLLPSSWLDELAIRQGLFRFSNEGHQAFRRRVMAHLRSFPKPTEKSFMETLSMNVGLAPVPLLNIHLKEVWNDITNEINTLAPDPYISISATRIKIWSDLENDALALDLSFLEKENGRFLSDIFSALESLDFITVEYLCDTSVWGTRDSRNLRYGDSRELVLNEPLDAATANRLDHNYIEEVSFINEFSYSRELPDTDPTDLVQDGDYHIDYRNGIVFSVTPGPGNCTYTRRVFPFCLYWDPVRAYPLYDEDANNLIYDLSIGDDGKAQRNVLNSSGADLVNEILQIHPLQWGE